MKGLLSRSFIGIAATQLFTSFNDNAYRWLIIPIGVAMLGKSWESAALAIGLACFVTPYILLFGVAGFLADRFPKRAIMSACMLAQTLILVGGVVTILAGSIVGAFGTLALMGAQGAILAPAKGGAIPETVREERVPAANGVCGLLAIAATVLGTVAGNQLFAWTKPAGRTHWWIYAAVTIGASLLGWGATLLVERRPSADPRRALPRRPLRDAAADLRYLWGERPLFKVACASSYFWFLASLSQVNVYLFATTELHVGAELAGPLLGILALGAGIGAIIAGTLSRGQAKLSFTPLSALGMAVSGILLYAVPPLLHGREPYVASLAVLFCMGLAAGFYDVPLQSFLQMRSQPRVRGRVLAATTAMMFLAMLVSSGVFWAMHRLLGLSGGGIFLVAGIVTLPVAGLVAWTFMGGMSCKGPPQSAVTSMA